jgi:hypothetical protein
MRAAILTAAAPDGFSNQSPPLKSSRCLCPARRAKTRPSLVRKFPDLGAGGTAMACACVIARGRQHSGRPEAPRDSQGAGAFASHDHLNHRSATCAAASMKVATTFQTSRPRSAPRSGADRRTRRPAARVLREDFPDISVIHPSISETATGSGGPAPFVGPWDSPVTCDNAVVSSFATFTDCPAL